MAERLTAFTDLLLSLSSIAFAFALWRLHENPRRKLHQTWFAFFVALATASAAGAIYHAIYQSIDPAAARAIWIVTMLAVGSSLSLLQASVFLMAELPRAFVWLPAIQFLAFVTTMTRTLDYRFVAYVSAWTIAVCSATILFTYLRTTNSGKILLAAFALSIVAAAAQQSTLHVGPLDRNGIYHLLQLAANALIFAAARASLRAAAATVREANA